MAKSVVANQQNIGMLINRFRKFVERNSEKVFAVNSVWGKPAKNETWYRDPLNKKLNTPPKVVKHFAFGESECLLSVCPQTLADFVEIHFDSYWPHFEEHYPDGINLLANPSHSFILDEGDEVFFKNEGIVVIPKRKHGHDRIRSWMLTTA